MPRLNARQLLSVVESSLVQAGWSFYTYDSRKPFGINVHRSGKGTLDLKVYIWNCTHGGGRARADDEYRIQFTGAVPTKHVGSETLLLGWYPELEVFAAWDVRMHENQDSGSPSAQIRRDVLERAYRNGFSVGKRANDEVVAAFKPEFIGEYAANVEAVHDGQVAELRDLDNLPNVDVREAERNYGRRRVVSEIARAYRAYDFSRRVLSAYGHACSICGTQLKLVEAAHIVPVACDQSTDSTDNGIALCVLHHRAYDCGLIYIDENYRVGINGARIDALGAESLLGGFDVFQERLREMIVLPADRRDYPSAQNIALSRRFRGW